VTASENLPHHAHTEATLARPRANTTGVAAAHSWIDCIGSLSLQCCLFLCLSPMHRCPAAIAITIRALECVGCRLCRFETLGAVCWVWVGRWVGDWVSCGLRRRRLARKLQTELRNASSLAKVGNRSADPFQTTHSAGPFQATHARASGRRGQCGFHGLFKRADLHDDSGVLCGRSQVGFCSLRKRSGPPRSSASTSHS